MLILKKESYMMLIKKPLNFIKKTREKNYYSAVISTTQHYNL